MSSKECVIAKWCEFAANTTTFLSPSIKKLLDSIKKVNKPIEYHGLNLINLLSSPFLSSMFCDQGSLLLHPTERSADWYIKKIKEANTFLANISNKFDNIGTPLEPNIVQLTNLCFWLHQQTTIQSCFELMLQTTMGEGNSHCYLECLLLTTAMLERGLGNLFLHISPKKKVPSLLRDLLASEELVQLLGQPNVVFLQLLLGSPLSLNLRNLVWHGFLGCGDIEAKLYASVLLVICVSIGSHLEKHCSIVATNFAPRRWAAVNRNPPKFMDFRNDDFIEMVNNTGGLPPNRKPIWLRAIQHYEEEHHGQCCVLILPEIEHTLRIIHCAVNDRPARLLTAESAVHYTTLDTILDGNNNQLRDFLGNDLYAALLDVFIEEEGPRIRDRFSHGECLLDCVSPVISQRLLSLSIAILRLAEPMHKFPEYSAYFSLAAIFKRELLSTLEDFGKILPISATIEPFSLDFSVWPLQYRSFVEPWLADWSTHKKFVAFIAEKRNQRTVIPYSNTWRQIIKQVCTGCKLLMQYESLTIDAQLRSRQRATRARFTGYLPFFIRGAQLTLLLPLAAFLGGELSSAISQSEKIRKTATRWADNFASNSLTNCWNELFECTRKLEISFAAGLPILFDY